MEREEPIPSFLCHCEERSDVAISRYFLRIGTRYREIATPFWARDDRNVGFTAKNPDPQKGVGISCISFIYRA